MSPPLAPGLSSRNETILTVHIDFCLIAAKDACISGDELKEVEVQGMENSRPLVSFLSYYE